MSAPGEGVVVVVPVHRNAATLDTLVERLGSALGGIRGGWAVRLVVDACPEGSGPVAAALAVRNPHVRVTSLEHNLGQHGALTQGLLAEPAAAVWVCMDADLQDPPEAVPLLLDRLAAGDVAGVFAGRRGAYETRGRRLTGTLHRRVLAGLTGLPPDAGAFLAMDARLRERLLAEVTERAAPSLVAAAGASGLPLSSIPVQREQRPVGTSSWTSGARLRQGARTLAWAVRRRLTAPGSRGLCQSRRAGFLRLRLVRAGSGPAGPRPRSAAGVAQFGLFATRPTRGRLTGVLSAVEASNDQRVLDRRAFPHPVVTDRGSPPHGPGQRNRSSASCGPAAR